MNDLLLTDALDPIQLSDLDTLGLRCRQHDGNLIDMHRSILRQTRPIPCNILYYQDQQLVGFLTPFFFYKNACEVIVLVDPVYRSQGIASKMIHAILPILQAQKISTAIFSTSSELNSHWLNAKGFQYENSEYQMHRSQHEPIVVPNKSFHVRLATTKDIPVLCNLDSACFPTQQPNMEKRFQQLLDDPEYRIIVAQKDNAIIGKAHIHLVANSAKLSDIAITPWLQGRGFGSLLLMHCINDIVSKNIFNIYLHVETNNQHALRLYTRLGFAITSAYDFWSISLDSLTAF